MSSITTPEMVSEFDYVIVGGGTAGLVIASRLSENSQCQVAVLEAGGDRLDDPKVNIPGMANLILGSELDWQFKTTDQNGLNGRQINQPQGRLLGGSSGINNQAFIAPSRAGVDAWASLGNDRWSWETLAPYYRKFFTLHLPDDATARHLGLDYIDTEVEGSDGPVQVSYTGVLQNPLAKAWVDTFRTLGFGMNSDPFTGRSIGGYANASTVDPATKTRSYAASAYLAPVKNRSNLHLLTGVEVHKIEFSNSFKSATAKYVVFSSNDFTKRIGVKREVIITAGAIQSPKILELSGIGDPKTLSYLDIPIVHTNKNVGRNLQDHLMTGISFEVQPGVETLDPLIRNEPGAADKAQKQYQEKSGPMTAGGIGSHAVMPFIGPEAPNGDRSELSKLLEARLSDPANSAYDSALRQIFEAPDEGTGAFFMVPVQCQLHGPQVNDENFISLGTNQCHTFSRGTVHIQSSNPSDPPVIDPRYFSDHMDLELMARQVMYMQTLAQTSPLCEYLKPDGKRNHPSAQISTLEAAKEYVKATAISNYHPCGTCAMLPEDRGGVVSQELLVYGTTNVRVADSSIIPVIPRANIQSTVYAVAERAADIIKAAA